MSKACEKLYQQRVEGGNRNTDSQKLFFCLNRLCDDLFEFLKAKGKKIDFKKGADPLAEMLNYVTNNASDLFLYRPKAAGASHIYDHVRKLHNQVRLSRNEICHLYEKGGEWSMVGVYFSGYDDCIKALNVYQHLLLVELKVIHKKTLA
jgi:hypothetical protein